VNLTLEVLSRRDDGYHTLRSVMVPIGIFDRIEIEPAERASFRTNDGALGENNLVQRALAEAGVDAPLRVELEKVIPVGGGLGGGSSDAATVLRAAMDGTLGPVAARDWIAAARRLGSDVPFFLAGTGALVEGTGERVTALGTLPPWWVVVAQPPVAVATADAYRRLDAARNGSTPSRPRSTSASLAAVDALQRGDFEALTGALVNDFHDVIVAAYPEIARAADALRHAGANVVLLSGSGSCLFAPFAREADARAAAARVPAETARTFAAQLHSDATWR
jgi:4-diphosphocytidyl-2-C-methyl-D-erythritol kinase